MKKHLKIYALVLMLSALLLSGCSNSAQDAPSQEPGLPGVTPAPEQTETPENMPTVYINELMASNKATLADDKGEFPDWLELYNYGADTARLGGCTLSINGDSASLPDISIAPGEYALIFCGSGEVSLTLPKEGAEISVFGSKGSLIDTFSYTAAESDISLYRNDEGALVSSQLATPGFENSDEGFAAFQASRVCDSPLVINEAMVYNEWYLRLNGAYYDWVELKNVSGQELLLSDYYLSDSGKDRAVYQLPEQTLAPGATFIVYCTGSADASGNCAPFALSAQSDKLLLSYKDGSLCDYTLLRGIKYGGSYGRMPGENGYFFFASPTPGEDNSGGARCIAAEPTASVRPGVYNDVSNMTLELRGGGDVYYTLDGSNPSTGSTLYTEPIPLSATTVVRAINVEDGKLQSNSADFSYIINENHTLPVTSLVADPDALFGGNGIYSNPVLRDERGGSVAFFDGENSFSIDCGIKIHGATSRFAQSKKSMKLCFRSRYEGELNYDLFENGVTNFSSVLLRAAQEDTFSTHMRDIFAHELAIKCFPSLLAQDYKYTVLYINGRYWGVYAYREAHSANHYANHYGYDPATVVQYKESWPYGCAVNDLYNFIIYNNMADSANYEYVTEHIDIDSVIGWSIIQAYMGNLDNNPPNFRMYYSSADDSSRFALVDLDLGMFKYSIMFDTAFNSGYAYSSIPSSLLANPQFRERFLTKLSECLNGEMSNDSANALLDELAEQIRPEMERECERWGYSVALWERMVGILHEYVNNYGGRARCLANAVTGYISMSDDEWNGYFGSIPTA